ncbi:IS66 family transposase [Sorangium sp. So ce1000]|uniref:IS66 family transposase n=1 Tax=Sorangium sp. So ce1000 TaxID=3133325 RepID=UPI003F6328D9
MASQRRSSTAGTRPVGRNPEPKLRRLDPTRPSERTRICRDAGGGTGPCTASLSVNTLHRQEKIYERQGVHLARSTLCGWVGSCAEVLGYLVAAMPKDALSAHCIAIDATGVLVQAKNWIFVGSDDGAEWNAIIVSLIALHQIDTWAYLRDVLILLPSWPRDRVLELAPKSWKQTLENTNARQRLASSPWTAPVTLAA